MKTAEERIEILEEKMLILQNRVNDIESSKENLYKVDSKEEMEVTAR
jgi:hypothetical protein